MSRLIVSLFVILVTAALSTVEANFGGVAGCYKCNTSEDIMTLAETRTSHCPNEDTMASCSPSLLVAAVCNAIMAPQFFCGRNLNIVNAHDGRQVVVKVIDTYSNYSNAGSNTGDLLLSQNAYELLTGTSTPANTATATVSVTWSLA